MDSFFLFFFFFSFLRFSLLRVYDFCLTSWDVWTSRHIRTKTCPPRHCRHPKKRVGISNEGKREPIVRVGARRAGDRVEGSRYFGTDECGQFVMSSLFFCYRRCLIFVFCSESHIMWSGPIFCLFLMRGCKPKALFRYGMQKPEDTMIPAAVDINRMLGNIVAARAVDREFEYKLWLEFGGGRRGRCAPPGPPCIPGGSAPQTPQKALHVLGCSGWSLFRDRATCPGQLRCPGQNFFS